MLWMSKLPKVFCSMSSAGTAMRKNLPLRPAARTHLPKMYQLETVPFLFLPHRIHRKLLPFHLMEVLHVGGDGFKYEEVD